MLKTAHPNLGLATLILAAAAVVAAPSGPSSAAIANPDPAVLGSWVMMEIEQGGMNIVTLFTIRRDRVELKSTCSYDGKTVVARASSSAWVSRDEIRVLEPNEVKEEYSPGYLMCNAKLVPMSMNYEIKNDKLVMHVAESGETREFPRAR